MRGLRTLFAKRLGSRIDAGGLRLTEAFEESTTLYPNHNVWGAFDADGLSFMNLNREEDLRRAEALLASQR